MKDEDGELENDHAEVVADDDDDDDEED